MEYFPIFKRYSVGIEMVSLMTPEDIELILTNPKHLEKSQTYNLLHDWLGMGLLTSKGQQWHSRRKILTPAFHFTILQEFVDIFNKETNRLVTGIKKICDQPYIDVVKPITQFTLYSIGETSLGKDFREDPKSKQYLQAVHDYGDNFVYRMVRPWLYHPFLYKLSSAGRRNVETIEILHDFSSNIIKERYKLFEENKIIYTDKKRLALLDLMIKARNNGAAMDDVAMREEIDTFILGGYDTTAVSLSHTLMLLANEEEIQEELYQEIIAVVENPNSPTFAELQDLKYAERCIKESLRIYPSAHIISRIAGEDVTTKDGYIIPKGCDICIHIIDMHRSPHLYENPEKFDPDRFLPENIAERHPYSYIPFSAGSRNCIGQKYAMLEMKAALCGILGSFKLEAVTKPKELRHKADIIIRPIGEIKVKFVLRK